MTQLEFLLKQVNFRLKEKPCFYICNDPERALGLETVLQNYYIVCIDDSDIYTSLKLEKSNIFSLENYSQELNIIYRNSVKLLELDVVRSFIESKSTKYRYFQTFKISPRFERLTEEFKAELLNTSALLNRQFENKLSQYEILSRSNIKFPETTILGLESVNFDQITKQLGAKFVVQFDRGHTGSSTIFIDSKLEFEKLQSEFPNRKARISKYIPGLSYTINAAVGRKGIYIGGLSYQITGVKGLTQSQGGTVGNDFGFREGLDASVLEKIETEVTKIGEAMRSYGYKGLFGVDLIVKAGEIYIIEVNARQPASIPFYTKLQLQTMEIPLALIHMMEFMGLVYDIDVKAYNQKNMQPIKAGQIFLRNSNSEGFTVKGRVRSGVYRLQSDDSALIIFDTNDIRVKENTIFLDEERDKPLLFQNAGVSIDDIKDGGMLILTQLQGKVVNPGNEIARIQARQSLVQSDGKPYTWVIESLMAIKEYLS